MEDNSNGSLNGGGVRERDVDCSEDTEDLKECINETLLEMKKQLEKSNGKLEDVTRKIVSVEEKIRGIEMNWFTAFNSLEDAMIIINRDFTIECMNRAGLELCHSSHEEAVGKKCHELIHDSLLSCMECPIKKSLESGKTETIERFEERFNRNFSITGSPIFNDNGNIVRFVDILRDISECKKKEEEIKGYSEKLDRMVVELKGAHEEIVKNEKLSVLGMLAGGVGHELRNPLGAIKNSSYFLNMALPDAGSEIKDTLGIIEKELAVSEKIVRKLDDFASAGTPQLRKTHVGRIVEKVLSQCTLPDNIVVVNESSGNIPHILTDPDQIGQIFGNIIINAVQAMPSGGRLSIHAGAPDERWVEVAFKDEGVGIEVDDLRKIFKPLYTTMPRGFGLGLVHSKKLVENNGGYIDVKSAPEKGSTFTVRLPVT